MRKDVVPRGLAAARPARLSVHAAGRCSSESGEGCSRVDTGSCGLSSPIAGLSVRPALRPAS